jgi:hypothetical protein
MQKTTPLRRAMRFSLVALTAATCGLCLSYADLVAKGKPGGGGGGNGGGTGPRYIVIDLGSFEATGGFRAEALNNLGGVVKKRSGLDELWQLDVDGSVLGVDSLPGFAGEPQVTWANDINDQFLVCGTAEYAFDDQHPNAAVAWDASGDQIELIELPIPVPPPGFFSISSAKGVSENGLICGRYLERIAGQSGTYNQKAFAWQVTESGVDTVELPGAVDAYDVNSDGIVVGRQPGGPISVWALHFDEFGVLVGASDPIPLPGLGGNPSEAFEITDSGFIAGSAWTASGEQHAVLWSVDGDGQVLGIDDLGLPASEDRAGAVGTNVLGEAVLNGRSENTAGRTLIINWAPYYADASGNVTNLNQLDMDLGDLKKLEIALDINDLGWISGTAQTRWTSNAFLAIPVQ